MRFTTVCRAELPRHATVRFRGGSGGRERAVADLDKVIDVRRCLEKQQRIDALTGLAFEFDIYDFDSARS